MDATNTYHEKLLNISRGYRDFIFSFKRGEDDNEDFIGFAEWLLYVDAEDEPNEEEDTMVVDKLGLRNWTTETYKSQWRRWHREEGGAAT